MDHGMRGTDRRRLWFVTVAVAVVVAAIVAYATLGTLTTSPAAPTTQTLSGFGGPFKLIDQDGRLVTDADFRGKWVLLYFGYTHCPDACPTALNTIAEALDQLGGAREKIQPLFITLDPERDTPVVLRDYTTAFQAGILGMTGSPEQIRAVAKTYRIAYEKHVVAEDQDYAVDHTSILFLLDPLGRPVSLFSHETPPDQLSRRMGEIIK
jgi:protein SCO1/2